MKVWVLAIVGMTWSCCSQAAYVSETRNIVSSGIPRSYVLARPASIPPGTALPLVFSLHGDGGNGANMRAALPLEAQATTGAVFVYPNAPGGTFEYYTYDGRSREAVFVTEVIAAMHAEFGIDTSRVFVVGFSGGATMTNALGCRLGPTVIRGLGIHSGTLYPVNDGGGIPDFTYTGIGGVSCPLPAAAFIWGENDNTSGVSFAEGVNVRNNYAATQACNGSTSSSLISPCVSYDGCTRELDWCAIPGMGHAIWSQAAPALWQFIDASAPVGEPDPIFSNGFEDQASAAFRGTNFVGMEMAYQNCDQAGGPIEGTNYPHHDERLVDYFASKHMTTLRFLFSWECMQQVLNGPIPAAQTGRYKTYFDNYKRIVDYATSVKGMRVIVEPWDSNSAGGAGGARYRGNVVGSGSVPTAAFADFWSRMATIFSANPKVEYGLINEPNDMSTMSWFASAQAAITAIRSTGATQTIYVPGNGYSAASSWTSTFYDTAATKRSNAYGWLNANGVGQPIVDPLGKIVAEVHTYLDADEGGGTTQITSVTAARDHISVALNEATAHGYRIYLGEIGLYAGAANAPQAWADFIAYFNANAGSGVFSGFTWFAGGDPLWWPDVAANGGGHFSISPTSAASYTGDTVNMDLIENDF
ncbi:MAG: cellulase family glycosylhydrolase [Xanthomonadales bacterium]|nr:cellulase family glycosylhydrolase [Xanthomonadales bacterium]